MSKVAIHKILAILKNLDSPIWDERSYAIYQFFELTDPGEVELLFDEIRDSDKSFPIELFLDHLTSFFKTDESDFLGRVLFYLTWFAVEHEESSIRQTALRNIDLFFETKMSYFIRVLALKCFWRIAAPEYRTYITEKVAEKKIIQLSSEIVRNLGTDDKELVLSSLKALQWEYKGAGARAHIRRVIRSGEEKFAVHGLIAFRHIADIRDYFTVRRYIFDRRKNVRIQAIRTYVHLYRNRAIRKLRSLSLAKFDREAQEEVIRSIAGHESGCAVDTLLDFLSKSEDPGMVRHIQWSLHNMPNKLKVTALIRRFNKGDGELQKRIIPIICDTNDSRIFKFIKKMILATGNASFRKQGLLFLASSMGPETIPFLFFYLKLATGDDIKYTLESMVRNNPEKAMPYLLWIMDYIRKRERELEFHEFFVHTLTYLTPPREELEKRQEYFLGLLKEVNFRFSKALMYICRYTNSEDIFDAILDRIESLELARSTTVVATETLVEMSVFNPGLLARKVGKLKALQTSRKYSLKASFCDQFLRLFRDGELSASDPYFVNFSRQVLEYVELDFEKISERDIILAALGLISQCYGEIRVSLAPIILSFMERLDDPVSDDECIRILGRISDDDNFLKMLAFYRDNPDQRILKGMVYSLNSM